MRKRILWTVGAVLAVAFVAYLMRPQPLALSIGAPERRDVQAVVSEEARTRLAREYLIDMPISGVVEPIPWEVGDLVTAGETLARVDTHDLEQQIAGVDARMQQARAQVEGVDRGKPKPEDLAAADVRVEEARQARAAAERAVSAAGAERDEAQSDLARAESLHAEGVVSRAGLDSARNRATAAEAVHAQAAAHLRAAEQAVEYAALSARRLRASVDDNEYLREVYEAEAAYLEAQRRMLAHDLERATLRAPVDGPVLEKFADHRRVLPAGAPLLLLGDLGSIEIESDVLSEEVVRVNVGDPVRILGKALGGGEAMGKVKRVYPSGFTKISALGIEQQRVKVLIDFDNSDFGLVPGARLDVEIVTDVSKDALAVPERALFRQDGAWRVFVVENGRAWSRPVNIGLRDADWAEALEGLGEDDRIVLDPVTELEDGGRVTPR